MADVINLNDYRPDECVVVKLTNACMDYEPYSNILMILGGLYMSIDPELDGIRPPDEDMPHMLTPEDGQLYEAVNKWANKISLQIVIDTLNQYEPGQYPAMRLLVKQAIKRLHAYFDHYHEDVMERIAK